MSWCDVHQLTAAVAVVVVGDGDADRRASASAAIEEYRNCINYGDCLTQCVLQLQEGTDDALVGICESISPGSTSAVRLACALQLARLVESEAWVDGSAFSDKSAIVQVLINVTQLDVPPKILDSVVRCLSRICVLEYPASIWETMVGELLAAVRQPGPFNAAATSFISSACQGAYANVDLWHFLIASDLSHLPIAAPFSSAMLQQCMEDGSLKQVAAVTYSACSMISRLVARRPSNVTHERYESLVTIPLSWAASFLFSTDIAATEECCSIMDGQESPLSSLIQVLEPTSESVDVDAHSSLTLAAGAIGHALRVVRGIRHDGIVGQLCNWVLAFLSGGMESHIGRGVALDLLETLHQLLVNSSAVRNTMAPGDISRVALNVAVMMARDVDFYSTDDAAGYSADDDEYFTEFLNQLELVQCCSSTLLHDCLNDDTRVSGSGWGSLREVAGGIAQQFVEDHCMNASTVLAPAIEILEQLQGESLAGRGSSRCTAAHIALGMIGDVARQVNDEGVCLLACFDAHSSSALLSLLACIAGHQPALDPSTAAYAAFVTVRCRALLCIAACVDLTDDHDALQGVYTICSELLMVSCADDPLCGIVVSTAAFVIGKVCGASPLAAEQFGVTLRMEHIAAASQALINPFTTHCALTFIRNAISLAPPESALQPMFEDSTTIENVMHAFVQQSANNPVLCNAASGLLSTIIVEHCDHPSAAGCACVQSICGIIIGSARSDGRTERLVRTAVECSSDLILSAQAAGGCSCSPHVGELVRFVCDCAKKGPFDDALARRVASCLASCSTVDFSVVMPGESPRMLVEAAATLALDAATTSSSAFNNSCMAYGLCLIAQAMQDGVDGLVNDFFPYVSHLGGFIMRDATDFALGGCFLPLAVMIAVDPQGTAVSFAESCRADDVRSALRHRQLISTVLSAWLAVLPHADLRVQSYSFAAWHQWIDIAASGSREAQFLLSEFGPDASNQPALARNVVRFVYLKSLHPKKSASDTSTTPIAVLRDACPVTFLEGMALAATIVREPQNFSPIRLATFANHDAYDQLNLLRWAKSNVGLPLPEHITSGILYGPGVVVVPYLVDQLFETMQARLDASTLCRYDALRSEQLSL